MRILLVSDLWESRWGAPARTLAALREALLDDEHEVEAAAPKRFLAPRQGLAELADVFRPDAVHIASEGPFARVARTLCLERRMPFTSEFLPPDGAEAEGWRRGFHAAAARVMVASEAALLRLDAAGWRRLAVWTPGVDLEAFHPGEALAVDLARPLTLWVGRLDDEGAVRRYLAARLGGTRFVVGDGLRRQALAAEFPDARFPGELPPRALRALYATADALVHTGGDGFPAPVWEALACGTPVASTADPGLGALAGRCRAVAFSADLSEAVERARHARRDDCRAAAMPWGSHLAAPRFTQLLVRGEWRPAAAQVRPAA